MKGGRVRLDYTGCLEESIGAAGLTREEIAAACRRADDGRRRYPRFAPENLETNLAMLQPVEALAEEKECTPAQLALAWLLAKGDDIVPIPGTKRRGNLAQNAGALDVKLSAQEIDRLEAAIPRDAAIGTRYPEPLLAGLNR